MNKLFVIDAINFLFRSYYAIGPMTSAKGQPTGAVYGFIRSVQKLIKAENPQHIVCVFDGPDNKRSRQKIYADYKGHRKDAPEDLIPQFDLAFQFCDLFGLPKLCIEGVEADDVMGTLALFAEKKGAKTFLCTSDKDMAQLVNENIFLMQPHKDYAAVDQKKVEEIFSVRPNQILDYLALTGDASDNIPGVPGFGPKTASTLLNEFGTLDNLLANIDQIKGAKKQATLRDNQELALISRQLATLDTKIEIPKELSFYEKKEPKLSDLIEFYSQMNFQSLLREIESIEKREEVPHEKGTYTLIDSPEKLTSLLSELSKQEEVCIDTETTGLDFMTAEIVGIGFGFSPGRAWYVPFNGTFDPLEKIKSFFETAKCTFYGHNIKYDLHILANAGIEVKKISFDTMLASYVLEPEKRRHNLDDLTLEKFHYKKTPLESLIGKGKKQKSMLEVPIETVSGYCGEDIDYTVRLKALFEKELKKKQLEKIFFDIELPLLPILAKMERHGVYLDTARLREIGKTLGVELSKLKTLIFEEAGKEFNLNSPKQLSEVLFIDLGLKKPAKAKTAFATGAEILEELSTESEVAGHILQFRALEKLRSTYVEALPESVGSDGKIHCSFNQSVAATGRLSSQDPNLQNIPTRSKPGKQIRSCFQPEKKGWSFIGGDYSQIELRLLAHLSGDEELIGAFKAGEDIHAFTASLIFNLPITMITPEMRHAAKTVNFGIIYGQGPFGLSKLLQISTKEASEFIKTYFERYPSIKGYLDTCKEHARERGYSTTLMGRKRPIPEVNSKNHLLRTAAERLSINTPLQGTAADLIKLAMIEINREIQDKRGKMVLQIHDELIFEVPDEEIPSFKKLIKEKMEGVFKLKVPVVVDIEVGKNWAEC